jgi:hypothetical protein
MTGGIPAFCTLCGSDRDPCGCERTAWYHDEVGYHPDDHDWRGCEPCYTYGGDSPGHANGMHVGVLVEGCPGCDCQGV